MITAVSVTILDNKQKHCQAQVISRHCVVGKSIIAVVG